MAKVNKAFLWVGVGAVLLYVYFSGDAANAAPSASGSISDNQLQQTKNFESFRAVAYKDGSSNGVQRYSIGYGHQIQPNESFLLSGSISEGEAEQMLLNDMQPVVNQINNAGQSFSQGQFDALADFGYSAGSGALNSALSAYLANGADAVTPVISAYVYWHPVPGGPAVLNQNLVNRRNDEVAAWNS